MKVFGEICNETSLSDNDPTKCCRAAADVIAADPVFHESCLSGHSGAQIASSSLELQVLSLTENKNILEGKSEELQGMLALKDSRIVELEKAVSGKEKSTCSIGLSEEKTKEVESELENLFRQKVETEVEYPAISKMMQNFKVSSAFTLLEKQVRVPNKLEEAHSKDSMLKNRIDELEKCWGVVLGVEETYVMQKTVCKLTFCLLLQFMLLILVFWHFVSQLSLNFGVFIPT